MFEHNFFTPRRFKWKRGRFGFCTFKLTFAEENVFIPAGTVIAKESFSVTAAGKVKPGPLFIMEKRVAGVSPETNDWYYMAVAPSGTPMAVNVMKACNECHMGNFGDQGNLGYPDPEVRVGQ